MSKYKELKGNELNHSYQPSDFRFNSTEDIKGANDFLGQDEAVEAIKQALKIEDEGYNLYICSENNQRMDEVIVKLVKKLASMRKPCKALGYLFNFHQPFEPTIVELYADMAIALRDDLEELSAVITNDLPIILDREEVKKAQKAITLEYEALKTQIWIEFYEKLKMNGVQLKVTDEGTKFMPLDENGKPLSLKAYEKLTEEKQALLTERLEALQDELEEINDYLERQEDYYYELYEEVKQEAVLKEVGGIIRRLQEKYSSYDKIQVYLNDLAEDILKHISMLAISESEMREARKELSALSVESMKEKLVSRYAFNILSLPPQKGAPVINDMDHLLMDLQGKVFIDQEEQNRFAAFIHIKPGLFHLAHEGYLILHMQNLIEKHGAWQSLKYLLRTKKLEVKHEEETGLSVFGEIQPQQVGTHIKVILIGSQELYELLHQYDDTFSQFFKLHVNLKEETKTTPVEIENLARAIKKIAKQEKLPVVTTDGLLRMVAYSNRKLGTPEKFESNLDVYIDLLREAKVYDKKCVDAACIEKVICDRQRNDKMLQKHLEDTILDATYLIDTEGEKVGQINGLAVYSVGESLCGRPIKITATTYRGQHGIVDIDGAAKLSGAIHTKGVRIITGFLGQQFAQDFPLTLSCNICMEQNYGAIDGDSASSAELYAIISSLSGLGIKQNFAVTGSMNQFGQIQPIGGVNEKIEGFYKICKLRGLKGNEGVIIPKQNSKELMLSRELIETVDRGRFHIYEVGTVWEAMSLLMGTSSDKIIKLTYEKLKKYSV